MTNEKNKEAVTAVSNSEKIISKKKNAAAAAFTGPRLHIFHSRSMTNAEKRSFH